MTTWHDFSDEELDEVLGLLKYIFDAVKLHPALKEEPPYRVAVASFFFGVRMMQDQYENGDCAVAAALHDFADRLEAGRFRKAPERVH